MALKEMLQGMATKTEFTDADVDALDHAFATTTDEQVNDAVMGLTEAFAAQTSEQKDCFHKLNQRLASKTGFNEAIKRLHTWREVHSQQVPHDPVIYVNTDDGIERGALIPLSGDALPEKIERMTFFLQQLEPARGPAFKEECVAALEDVNHERHAMVEEFWDAMEKTAAWPGIIARHPTFDTVKLP